MPNRKFELNATDKNNLIDFKTGKHINPVLSIVCDRIKYYRAKRGIEQKALADQLGVTGNSISNWENGRSRPDVNLLPTIAKALGISLYDLYGIDDPRLQYTDGEQSLVSRFRDLTPGHQKAVNSLIDQLLVTQAIENCPIPNGVAPNPSQRAAELSSVRCSSCTAPKRGHSFPRCSPCCSYLPQHQLKFSIHWDIFPENIIDFKECHLI